MKFLKMIIFLKKPDDFPEKSSIFSDFVIVQSAWGMTQGFVMPLSGFLITAIGEKVAVQHHQHHRHHITTIIINVAVLLYLAILNHVSFVFLVIV